MKYRIWDKVKGKHLDLKKYFVNGYGQVCDSIDSEIAIFLNQQNYIIEQSTGIYDINGVELFEGDKVIIKPTFIGDIYNGYIQYNCGSYIIRLGDNYALLYDTRTDKKWNLEKIGTIHDKEY